MIKCPKQYEGQVLTIVVTNDCNLRCKYCYEIDKKDRGTISLKSVEKFAKMIVAGKFNFKESKQTSYEIDLLGGDALMYPELCSQIIDTIIKQFVLSSFSYRNNFKFSICTNGTLFGNSKVREFLIKYKDVLSIGVSVDGCPTLHDMNRVYKNGNGSMAQILKWWPWFKANFPNDAQYTKSTLTPQSIPYMLESLKFLHEELGIKYIHQNFIMEDSHISEGDLKLLNSQMTKCCDYVFQHRNELYWSMIDKNYTRRSEGIIPSENRCGSGSMPTVDIDGKLYACPRWCPFACGPKTIVLGDVEKEEYDLKKATEILELTKRNIITKDEKCKSCAYEAQCSFCPAGCYSEFGEFKRTTHICQITEIQAKWASFYWSNFKDIQSCM